MPKVSCRCYVESLSSYARQFLGQMPKPEVDRIDGLSPSISIQQKTGGRNPRSTVGTITEINDYLRVLYGQGRAGALPQLRPSRGGPDSRADRGEGAGGAAGRDLFFYRCWRRSSARQKGEYKDLFAELQPRAGYVRARVNGHRLSTCP